MILEESFLTNQGIDSEHEWAEYKIFADNKEIFSVKHDTNDKDNNTLFENFKDCYNIINLLKQFHEYGKQGIELEFKIK